MGGVTIKGALEKAGLDADQVEYLIMGQGIQAGTGQNAARTAGVAAGVPMSVPSITINKVCLSGINAIALADQRIITDLCVLDITDEGLKLVELAPGVTEDAVREKTEPRVADR